MVEKGLLPLTSFLTYRIARVQAKLNAQGTRLLKDVADVSLAQWRILAVLGFSGKATSAQLSRDAQIDKGLLSRKLKTLIDGGLVASTPHPTDRRVQNLALTEAGQAKYEATLPHTRARQGRLMGLMSASELEVFFDVLERIEAALDKEAQR